MLPVHKINTSHHPPFFVKENKQKKQSFSKPPSWWFQSCFFMFTLTLTEMIHFDKGYFFQTGKLKLPTRKDNIFPVAGAFPPLVSGLLASYGDEFPRLRRLDSSGVCVFFFFRDGFIGIGIRNPTPLKINIESENDGLVQMIFLFQGPVFSGEPAVNLPGCKVSNCPL